MGIYFIGCHATGTQTALHFNAQLTRNFLNTHSMYIPFRQIVTFKIDEWHGIENREIYENEHDTYHFTRTVELKLN